MTYDRTCPRDLFNEGKLLTEMGFLILGILDNKNGIGDVLECEYQCNGFDVEQNPDDGSIYISNLPVSIKTTGETINFYRPLNSRSKYSLKFDFGDYFGDVFDDNDFSDDFVNFVKYLEETNAQRIN